MPEIGIILRDGIGPRLDYLAAFAAENVAQAMEQGKDEVVAYAQQTAPWADRTGMARANLHAEVFEEDGFIVLELSHGVDYGEWLEVIQDGRFAVIMPTLETLGPKIIRDAGGKVLFMGGGI